MTEAKPKFLFSCLLSGDRRGEDLDFADIERWTADQGKLWLHIDVRDQASRDWLSDESGLPVEAIDTLLAEETRPRSNIVSGGLLLVLRGVNTNPGENPEDMVSVRVWVDENRIISSRRRRLLSVIDVHKKVKAGEGPTTPAEFLAAIVERLAERIGGFVDSIEDRIDTAEDDIETASSASTRPQLSALRRQIAAVRRFLAPQRDALDRLNRHPVAFLSSADAQALREEADRITRYLEDLDLARERTVVLQEELLSKTAQEQNARMYVLSVVAAIFLPLTFVTGLLGMNVGGLPGIESPRGFVASVVIMCVAAAVLLAYFRWKRWL
jgi:zinc transporter